MCPGCRRPLDNCHCKKDVGSASGDGVVRIHRETKGRKGQGVTVITGIPLEPEALRTLAKTLKQKCSSGGTVKDGAVEIQGDHRDLLANELRKQGWTVLT